MKQMSKKQIAWLVIFAIVIIGAVTSVFMKNRGPVISIKSGTVKKPSDVLTMVDFNTYRQKFVTGDKDAEDKIIVIRVEGELTNSRMGISYKEGMVDDISDQIDQANKDKNVRAIILDIDSPGGPVIDADIVYEKIKEVSSEKVVIALLDRVAASGGYYIACAADRIVAHPLTITGNIGVIMDFINVSSLLEKKLGVEMNVIKSGQYKDIGSPYRRMSVNEKKMMQDMVNSAHKRFVGKVASGRKMPFAKAAKLADGRIFSGEQAKEAGLVDTLGTLDNAVDEAKKILNIKKVKVVEYYSKPNWKEMLFTKLPGDVKVNLNGMPAIANPALKYMWQPGLEK